jgi:hypothetical protein
MSAFETRPGAAWAPPASAHPDAGSRPSLASLAALRAWLERHALFVFALAAGAAMGILQTPMRLRQDGWLALVDGRYIATHGIPRHDPFGVLTHGVRWIDQQWLSQLAIYGSYRLGGLALYSIVTIVLAIGSLGAAVAIARRLGGTDVHVLWILPVAGLLFLAGALVMRTQSMVYPLFVATLGLLVSETRGRPSRRVYWVFPLLVLWGNLHGSATLGAALALLYGVTLLVDDLRSFTHTRRVARRTLAFLVLPPLCLLATPYGLSIVEYYHSTLFNSAFSTLVTEWRPVTSSTVLAVPFFALAFAGVWVLGRSGRRTPLFDQLVLLLVTAITIFTIRNIVWFSLVTVMLLPAAIRTASRERPASPRRPALNLTLATAGLGLLLLALLVVSVRPPSWFERHYDSAGAQRLAALARADPQAKIYADQSFADWLLWHDPQLAGRVAFDTRLELLTRSQLLAIAQIPDITEGGQTRMLDAYRILLLDPAAGQATAQLLRRRRGTHVLMRDARMVIATWAPGSS